jgi:hypothetical protein
MGTVTQYNLANVRDALGGSNPVSMNQYYRGGARVPSTRSVYIREPTSGDYYARTGTEYYWEVVNSGFVPNSTGGAYYIEWASVLLFAGGSNNFPTYTTGGWTYVRASHRQFTYDSTYAVSVNLYAIYREQTGTVNINTGVPSSGQISISQLFGAENP